MHWAQAFPFPGDVYYRQTTAAPACFQLQRID